MSRVLAHANPDLVRFGSFDRCPSCWCGTALRTLHLSVFSTRHFATLAAPASLESARFCKPRLEGFRLGKRFPLSQKLRCYRVSKAPYSVDEDEEEQEQQQQEQQQEQEQEQE